MKNIKNLNIKERKELRKPFLFFFALFAFFCGYHLFR